MPKKISLINLGCARNLVDAQEMLARLSDQGFEIVSLENAETVVINTCGFINDAKKESVDAIVEAVDWKKQGRIQRVVVAGCLSQRYADELKKEFPEVDAWVGVPSMVPDKLVKQVALCPDHMAYVKICESCFHHCAFCIIPKIKGRFVSRSMESILQEIGALDEKGVRELNLIGQDITAYGLDVYGQKSLPQLLTRIAAQITQIRWIRLLYMFPAHITDELLDVMAAEKKICRYVDVPFQHVSNTILTAMNRGISAEQTRALVEKIRKKIPGVRIRSAFIVGLPGEGEQEFEELMDFVRWARFDRMGVFMYSPEEGTPAFSMPKQVSEQVKRQRRDQVMRLQQEISLELNRQAVGEEMAVLVEGYDETVQRYFGRSEFHAPDVDGVIYICSDEPLPIGEFVTVKIIDAQEYDLVGEMRSTPIQRR